MNNDKHRKIIEEFAKNNPEKYKKDAELSNWIIETYKNLLETMTLVSLKEFMEIFKENKPEEIPQNIYAIIGMAFQQGYLAKEREIEKTK